MAGPEPYTGLNEGAPQGPGGAALPMIRPDVSPSMGQLVGAELADTGRLVAGQYRKREEEAAARAKRLWLLTTTADMEGAADRLAMEHKGDPAAFEKVYAATVKPHLDAAPDDEARQLAELEATRYGRKGVMHLTAERMARDEAAVEADALQARDDAEARYYNALRSGDYAMTTGPDGTPVMTGAAAEYRMRADALDEHLLAHGATGRQIASARLNRQALANEHMVLGEFDRELARGFGAAEDFIAEAKSDSATIPDPGERDRLVAKMEARYNDARREVKARLDAVAEAGKQAVGATARNFLNRIYRPSPENGGPLTEAEILDSNLPDFGKGSKKSFIDLLDKSPADVRYTDPTLYVNLYRDIDEGRITDPDMLRGFVGHGLGPEDHNRLRDDVVKRTGAAADPVERRKKEFLSTIESRLSGSTAYVKDPDGDERFYAFQVAFDREFKRRVRAGDDPMELMDPTSAKYLGNMPEARKRSMTEVVRAQADAMKREAAAAAEPDPAPTAAPTDDTARRPGESPADYLKRMGLE